MKFLREQRRAADCCAVNAQVRRSALRGALGVIEERVRPYRSRLTVGTGLLAGVAASLLPMRNTIRIASLLFDATLMVRRVLPERVADVRKIPDSIAD